MTFLVLLTAIPVAAVLGLFLDNLLDRRLAAVNASARRPTTPKNRGHVAILAFAALGGLATFPAIAQGDPHDPVSACAEVDCSLTVESSLIERLWSGAPAGGVIVAQSRIPAWFESGEVGDRIHAGRDTTADEQGPSEPTPALATDHTPTDRP